MDMVLYYLLNTSAIHWLLLLLTLVKEASVCNVWWLMQRLVINQNSEIKWLLSSQRVSVLSLSHLGEYWGRVGEQRTLKPKGGGKCCEILSAAFHGSPELGQDHYTHELTCPCLQVIGPNNIPSWFRKGLMTFQSTLRNWWRLMVLGGSRVIFFSIVATGCCPCFSK